jgi:alpha-galactosidase
MSPHPNLIATPKPSATELARSRQWLTDHLPPAGQELPFSFVYRGKPGGELLAVWPRTDEVKPLDEGRTQQMRTWRDPETGLEVRCIAVIYADFPVVEWTVYFKNTGNADTPILEQIQAFDVRIEREKEGEFVLHHCRGDFCTPDSYQPFAQVLWHNTSQTFAPVGGRPTNSSFPYFNLQTTPDARHSGGGGLLLAVGWPGQWAVTFQRDAGRGLHIRAGQELTHLYLEPGEEIRTPLIALMFYDPAPSRIAGGDMARAQNLWRRWMLAHNLPRTADGRVPAPVYTSCSGGFFPNLKVSEASEKLFIDALTREGIKLDYWWMDAGWYPCEAWPQVGTWEPDPERFPQGLKAVSDYVHARNTQLIVWFEPERVKPGTWLYENHSEWLLGRDQNTCLLNLGDPVPLAWVIEYVDRFLTEQGIDLYRQDFNMDPLSYWRRNDTPDRQGSTENHYVQGYLAYWDALRARHPGMLIDSCASGGRRNDLETLRRAVPLLRSDYQSFQGDPVTAPGNQGHTYGISSWIPYHGQGVYYNPFLFVYSARSYMTPALAIGADVRKENIEWGLIRRMIAEWRQVADCYLGDYYPLTPYSLDDAMWMAWQFNLPERGTGMVQAFRRAAADAAEQVFRLSGLDPAAEYIVQDLDNDTPRLATGETLMGVGLTVRIMDQPGAAIIRYSRRS